MSRIKKLIIAVALVLIAIQFVKPARNTGDQVSATDISKIVSLPDSVQVILKNACYDCHSNNTTYPWYSNFQPFCWLMDNHIKQGKGELNFSEFGYYSLRRQASKLNGIANSIKDDIMPLASYRIMHKNARLSGNEKALVIRWANRTKDNLPTEK